MQPILELHNASLGYPDKIVLEHLNWRVLRGERWAITGPNGSGKTTLMRTRYRLDNSFAMTKQANPPLK